jgi:hypothetical protein
LTSKRQLEVRWLAVLLLAYFAYNHLWALWGVMPNWYNLLIMVPVVPMVLVGGALAQRLATPRDAGVARPSLS